MVALGIDERRPVACISYRDIHCRPEVERRIAAPLVCPDTPDQDVECDVKVWSSRVVDLPEHSGQLRAVFRAELLDVDDRGLKLYKYAAPGWAADRGFKSSLSTTSD